MRDDFVHLKLHEAEYCCELRDVSELPRFLRPDSAKRKLKDLAADYLNADVQTGHHSSIIDARVALALYRTFQMEIEDELGARNAEQSQTSLLARLMSLQLSPQTSWETQCSDE